MKYFTLAFLWTLYFIFAFLVIIESLTINQVFIDWIIFENSLLFFIVNLVLTVIVNYKALK